MAGNEHVLAREFPEKVWKIHRLMESNSEFARLCDEYAALTEAVYQAEADPDRADQTAGAQIRHAQAGLKLRIWEYLKQ